jgi:hypothetical protein
MMPHDINPRVVCWAKSRGEDVRTLLSERFVVDAGDRLLWTIVYSEWIMARWQEWAGELGFTRHEGGNRPHENAQANGHTADEFDAWLKKKVGL